jgi:GT2 family glycosyltransferase
MLIVDAVICTYNEEIEKINLTLESCLNQTYKFKTIYLVDDGSDKKIQYEKLIRSDAIQVLELENNGGISKARNTAINLSNADYIACINIEVVLSNNWLEEAITVLKAEAQVGCVFGRITPFKKTLLSQWRMRFHEIQFDQLERYTSFAPGHAVLFKSIAIKNVGGYNERLKLIQEDSDICERINKCGYLTCYVSSISSSSMQEDSLEQLSKKHIVRIGGNRVDKFSLSKFFIMFSKDFMFRVCRNIYTKRFYFLTVDLLIYLKGFKYFNRRRSSFNSNRN